MKNFIVTYKRNNIYIEYIYKSQFLTGMAAMVCMLHDTHPNSARLSK